MPVKIAEVDGLPIETRSIGEVYDELGKHIKKHGREHPLLIRLIPPPKENAETGEEEFDPDEEMVTVALDVIDHEAVISDDPEIAEPAHVALTAAVPDDFLMEDIGDAESDDDDDDKPRDDVDDDDDNTSSDDSD